MSSKSAKSVEAYKASEEKRNREREDAEQSSLFREVNDDLRSDQFQTLWKRYGMLVIGGAVAIVISVAGYQIYKGMMESERKEQGTLLDQAYSIEKAGDAGKAMSLLSQLEANGNAGYRTLSRMKRAAMLIDQGKLEDGRQVLKLVSSDAETLPAYRDLAVVLDALAGIDSDKPASIEDQLAPMTAAGHPWRHVALELSALAIARGGEPGRAATTLKEILDDPDTAAAQRNMAEKLRTVFLNDAKAAK